MSQAVSGHGATIAIELDIITPGVFTVVAELNGDITWPGLNRPETEVTPHQDTIDSFVTGRLGREALSFSVNYVFDDPTHDHLTGLQAKIIDNEFFGVRLRGPGGSTNSDEIIASGHVTAVNHMDPVREGARSAQVTIRLSKRQKIDGVFFGETV
jgi:hypothetical protein